MYIISILQRKKRCKTGSGILAYPVLCLYKQFNPEFYSWMPIKWHISGNMGLSRRHCFTRYFIEQISGTQHIKTILCSRFVQFVQSLDKCEKLSIRLLVNLSKNDFNTVLCKHLHSLARDCNMNIDNLDKFVVKQNVKYFKTPAGVEWKILLLKELLDIRNMCNLFVS